MVTDRTRLPTQVRTHKRAGVVAARVKWVQSLLSVRAQRGLTPPCRACMHLQKRALPYRHGRAIGSWHALYRKLMLCGACCLRCVYVARCVFSCIKGNGSSVRFEGLKESDHKDAVDKFAQVASSCVLSGCARAPCVRCRAARYIAPLQSHAQLS
jgi:hypothetical protein